MFVAILAQAILARASLVQAILVQAILTQVIYATLSLECNVNSNSLVLGSLCFQSVLGGFWHCRPRGAAALSPALA